MQEVLQPVRVQISFNGTSDVATVKEQLLKYKSEHPHYQYMCGFLTRKIVQDNGFNTEIVDMLDEVFGQGGQLVYVTEQYETLENVKANMTKIREELKYFTDKMIVFGDNTGLAPGVIEEIKIQSFGRVEIIR